ncbi:HNH endonuclease family protein [Streptomyces sp. NPDC006459]|uniref:HNH endonuclease family protein n=1 Tax=Streptomyces sp. NPDC006459 TaxID=3154303 RepID=UPI0033AD412D
MALAVLPAALTTHAAAASTNYLVPQVLPLASAVSSLRVAEESRTGYQRGAYRHWNAGDDPADACNTRNEVLIGEAVQAPTVKPRCALTGGSWYSYYDGQTVTNPGALDIDHMVPLAEAWDSGASAWTPAHREAYANDQGQYSSLIAVTARSNRSKSDQDPAEWLPPHPEAICRYTAEWTATKLRWDLAADPAEHQTLTQLAALCQTTTVTYTPALTSDR